MSAKIIQILVSPEDCKYQGSFLGLGDDGVVYVANGSNEWEVYFPLIFKQVVDTTPLHGELTVRAVNVLRQIGINTNNDLIESGISSYKLKGMNGCGKATTTEICDYCDELMAAKRARSSNGIN